MLSRQYRFHGHGSLNYVYRHGQTERGSSLAVKWALNNRRQRFRAAVVVSAKVSKSAVVRNRIRRRIYSVLSQSRLENTRPYDIIVTVFDAQLAKLPAEELSRRVRALLAQAGILRSEAPDRHGIVEGKES